MYKVYLDNILIYHPNDEALKLGQAKLDLAVNSAGSFAYIMHPNHPHYGTITKMKSIVEVYRDADIIFRGRVLNTQEGFNGELNVVCEGDLSFLIDSVQRPYEFKGPPADLFRQFISNHNAQVDDGKKFATGYVTVSDNNDYINRADSTYLNTLESVRKKLVEPCGGYLQRRYECDDVYLDYLAELDQVNEQVIEFGENLLDFARQKKSADIATVIIPLGAKGENGQRLTIASVNDGLDYICDDTAIAKHGKITKIVTFDDVTLASNLKTKGEQILQKNSHTIESITVSAIDLSSVGIDIEAIEVGKWTRVKSKPHNLDDLFFTASRSLDLLNPQNSVIQLGAEIKTLTDKTSSQARTLEDVSNAFDMSTGTLIASMLKGVVDMRNVNLRAQLDAAQRQDVVAMLFEDLDPGSPTFGAMAQGTQGIQISRSRNDEANTWNWSTAIDFQSVYANMITTGILTDKSGRNYWNLDTGDLHTGSMEAIDMYAENATIVGLTAEDIDVDGLDAVNADVSGKVTSTQGRIGNWEIVGNGLKSVYVQQLPAYTLADAEKIKNHILGCVVIPPSDFDYYDANQDGALTAADHLLAKDIANGVIARQWTHTYVINGANPSAMITHQIDRGGGKVANYEVSISAISINAMKEINHRILKLEQVNQ